MSRKRADKLRKVTLKGRTFIVDLERRQADDVGVVLDPAAGYSPVVAIKDVSSLTQNDDSQEFFRVAKKAIRTAIRFQETVQKVEDQGFELVHATPTARATSREHTSSPSGKPLPPVEVKAPPVKKTKPTSKYKR
jgi:hypothetical protein